MLWLDFSGVCLGIIVIKSEQVCESRLFFWEACCVADPEPVLPTVPREQGCSFCLKNSSQAWPMRLFWSVSAVQQPALISHAQSYLPNDGPHRSGLRTDQLTASTCFTARCNKRPNGKWKWGFCGVKMIHIVMHASLICAKANGAKLWL